MHLSCCILLKLELMADVVVGVTVCRTFPQYMLLEQSLRTGEQPALARQLVVPVLQAFKGQGLHLRAFEILAASRRAAVKQCQLVTYCFASCSMTNCGIMVTH